MDLKDILLPSFVLVIGLIIGIYLVAPALSIYVVKDLPPIVFAALYFAGLPILAVAGAGFGVSWYRGRERGNDGHRQEILGLLQTPVSIVGGVEYTSNPVGEMIVQRPMVWVESDPLYPSLLAHMQNYGETLALLDSAKDYSAQQREKIVQQIQAIDSIVEQKLISFKGLTASEIPPEKAIPYCLKHLVSYAVYTNARKLAENSEPIELQMEKMEQGKRKTNQLLWGTERVAVGSTVALKRLNKLIQTTAKDPQVSDAVMQIGESEKQLKANPQLSAFETKRSEIVFALSAGKHMLPGHCDRCN